jgi:phospholipase/carboxylesterase
MTNQDSEKDPHRGQPVRFAGEALMDAQVALLMVHGRGAQAEDILTLVPMLKLPGVAFVAPQASGNAWYPNRFMAPIHSNEPWLSSALAFIDRTVAHIAEVGIPAERTILLGFSQGACLILEYAARNARRYGGLAGLSGGLIGPKITPGNYPGSLDGTPVFLGCSDVDFHIPKERVDETAEVLGRMGGQVTERLYPNMEHTVSEDEIAFVRGMLSLLAVRH